MPTIKEMKSDIAHLKTVYDGLGRGRAAIFTYLDAVYRTSPRWRGEKHSAIREKVREVTDKSLDRRITASAFRLIIELTCAADVKLRLRYANALKFAHSKNCPPASLQDFIRRNGGLEACARAWTELKQFRELLE